MNAMIDREFAAQVLIALAAAVGAWMVFVEPKSSELASLEQTIVARSSASPQGQLPVAMLAAQAGDVRSRIREIARHNNAALNSSDLYARIGRLANEHSVIVQNMRPGSQAKDDDSQSVQTVKIDLSVEGAYDDAAEFLDALASMEGFVRPVTMSISPISREGVQLVVVHYVCEVLRFTMPDALAEFQEVDHDV